MVGNHRSSNPLGVGAVSGLREPGALSVSDATVLELLTRDSRPVACRGRCRRCMWDFGLHARQQSRLNAATKLAFA